MRLLLVEDHPELSHWLQKALTGAGFAVEFDPGPVTEGVGVLEMNRLADVDEIVGGTSESARDAPPARRED